MNVNQNFIPLIIKICKVAQKKPGDRIRINPLAVSLDVPYKAIEIALTKLQQFNLLDHLNRPQPGLLEWYEEHKTKGFPDVKQEFSQEMVKLAAPKKRKLGQAQFKK